MQIETLKDVLHWTTEFHQHLSQCLTHCADSNENTRAKLLLDYLATHETKLAQILHRFEQTANTNALNTWCYEYLDKHPIIQHNQCDKPFAKMNTHEIMGIIVDQHEQLISLYRYLQSRADTVSAQELLGNLTSLEEHEAMQMMQSANRLEDI